MILFVISFLTFLLAGFGLGGGVLFIPILTIFLSYSAEEARLLAVYSYIAAAIGVVIFSKKNNSILKKIMPLLPFGLFFSVVGALFSHYVDTDFLKKAYGFYLILFGIFMLIKNFRFKKTLKRKKMIENI